MEESRQVNTLRNPIISILITLVIFFVGFQILGPALGFFLSLPFYDGSETDLTRALTNPTGDPSVRVPLMIMQATGVVVGMVVIPWFFLRKQQRNLTHLFYPPHIQPALIIPVLVIVFMGVNSMVIQWNENVSLPFGLEETLRPLEQKLAELTVFLTKFTSSGEMIFAFFVIAVLPAIGEEIIFRGMIQNDFYRGTRNIHLSIWLSAIIFSAIHLQFYGFFPRMLLGALFGYLYAWSGNLWMPILAHFVNNGFTLISLYFVQKGSIPIDVDKVQLSPYQILFSAAFSAILLFVYKNFYNNRPKADIPA